MEKFLSKNLPILILVPALVLSLVLMVGVFHSFLELKDAKQVKTNVLVAEATSNLVHELQKERGMSAGYLGSAGTTFREQLKSQRQLTDNRRNQLSHILGSSELTAQESQAFNQILRGLQPIGQIRNQIDSLSIELGNALSFYTQNNLTILDLNGVLAQSTSDLTISRQLNTLYSYAFGKEQAGVERAVLTGVFTRDSFTSALKRRFIELVTKQQTYFKSAKATSDSEFLPVLNGLLSSPEQQAVESYRQKAYGTQDDFGVDSQSWFDSATARINKLKQAEESLIQQINLNAAQLYSEASTHLVVQISILLMALVVTAAVYYSVQVTKKQSVEIEAVVNEVVGRKDLTCRVKQISFDNLGQVALKINSILDKFQQDLSSFRQFAMELNQASQHTSEAVAQSQTNLAQQQTDVSSIASAVEELSINVKQVVEGMLNGSEKVKLGVTDTKNGENAVQSAVAEITQLSSEVNGLGQAMEDLNNRVGNISGMVEIIQSVAEQTNLLALNAAIEAARAGEQGRGFAVVAEEVRNLAKRTQNSTEEISDIVSKLQEGASASNQVLQSGKGRVDAAVGSADDISQALTKIVDNIQSIEQITSAVSSNAEQQNDVIQEINQNIVRIDSQAQDNVEGAKTIADLSERTASISLQMEQRILAYQL